MNTKNNKRRQNSREKIERAFTQILQTKEIGNITVSEICKETNLNRSTFYANYEDIYDLADKIRIKLENDVKELYDNDITLNYSGDGPIKILYHIRENQLFYNTYFKLGYDTITKIELGEYNIDENMFGDGMLEYHIEFFRSGFNAMVKKWLSGGCKESPEQLSLVLKNEYRGRR